MAVRIKCEQVIYTSAVTEKLRGYQIVAKSSGLTPMELDEIEKHSLPSKAIPPDFKFSEATRYYHLSTGKICIARMINAGRDEFGRPNRIYTHTIALTAEQFAELNYNPLGADNFFIHNEDLRGEIDCVEITQKPTSITRLKNLDEGEIENIINALISGEKTMIITDTMEDEKKLICEILINLPVDLRFESTFSTFAMKIEEPYKILIMPNTIASISPYSLPPNVCMINLATSETKNITRHPYASFIAEKIYKRDFDTITNLNSFLQSMEASSSDIDVWYEYWKETGKIGLLVDDKSKADHYIMLAKMIEETSSSKAVEDYCDGIKLYKKIGAVSSVADAYISLTNIDKDRAGKWFRDGFEYFKSLGLSSVAEKENIISFLDEYTRLTEGLEPKQRLKVFDEIFQVYTDMESRTGCSEILEKKAETLLDMVMVEDAIASFKESMRLFGYGRRDFITKVNGFIDRLERKEMYVAITDLCKRITEYLEENKVGGYRLYRVQERMIDATDHLASSEIVVPNCLFVLNTLTRSIGYVIDSTMKKNYERLYSNALGCCVDAIEREENVDPTIKWYLSVAKSSMKFYGELPRALRNSIASFAEWLAKKGLHKRFSGFVSQLEEIAMADDKTLVMLEKIKEKRAKVKRKG